MRQPLTLLKLILIGLSIFLVGFGCTSFHVVSRQYLYDLDYAQPEPGGFTYVSRDLNVTIVLDTDTEEIGSEEFANKITTMLTRAMGQLVQLANLQDNQVLYNIRVSAPIIDEVYVAPILFIPVFWTEGNLQISITADVIEFL